MGQGRHFLGGGLRRLQGLLSRRLGSVGGLADLHDCLGVDLNVLPNIRVGFRVLVVGLQGVLQLLAVHGVQRRVDDEVQHRGVRHDNVHEHGQLAGYSAGDRHLLGGRGIAYGDQHPRVAVEAHFPDGEAAHAVLNDDLHVDHVGGGGTERLPGDLSPPPLVDEGGLAGGGRCGLAPAVTGGGLHDGQLLPVQNTVRDDSRPLGGDYRPILRLIGDHGLELTGHLLFPPLGKFPGWHDTPERPP